MANEAVSKESKDTAGLMWILAMFLSIFSSAFFYITKKDDPFVHAQAKLALNLSLNVFIVAIAYSIVVTIAAMILSILATILSLCGLAIAGAWIYICFMRFKSAKEDTPAPKIPYAVMFIK